MKDKILKWNDVLNFANNGNPAPDRRVEKKDEEWRQQLTEEEFYITRKKGTEARFSGEHCSRYEPGNMVVFVVIMNYLIQVKNLIVEQVGQVLHFQLRKMP